MNLARMLRQRAEDGRPVRVGVIGAGKFSTMFMTQARTTRGLHVIGIADLVPERARQALKNTGWDVPGQIAKNFSEALSSGKTVVTDDANALIDADIEVLVDITGNPAAATRHILRALERGKHVVNVTVEADVLVGPLLAERARKAGLVYALAYGDQPALVCEMVDWAEACGFRVVAAGKGTKYLPAYHASTPDTVWNHYGISAAEARAGGMKAQMFNSFLDGTKSAIEMAAIANATGLAPPAARGIITRASSSAPQGGKARPSRGAFRPVALEIAAISIADLVPSTNELNICGFMPAAFACSGVMPKWVHTVSGVDW